MKEYKVRKLLEETNFKKLKYYSLYKDRYKDGLIYPTHPNRHEYEIDND